jgi:hypothetical protein
MHHLAIGLLKRAMPPPCQWTTTPGQLLLGVQLLQLLLCLVAAVPDVADPAVDQGGGGVWQLQGGLDRATIVVATQDDGFDLQGVAAATMTSPTNNITHW